MRERIYIYIYRERERERGVCVCVEASVFASWLLKIPTATLITKACFGGKKTQNRYIMRKENLNSPYFDKTL